MKKAALNVLVRMLTSKQLLSLKSQFEVIDKDNSGYIDSEELYNAMKQTNMDIPTEKIDQIINEVDYHGNK